MTRTDQEIELIAHACKDHAAAIHFVQACIGVFHAVDDLVDQAGPGPIDAEECIRTMVRCMDLYAHPFFVQNAAALNATLRGCISTWADSVAWERSSDPDKRAWADLARHAGLELIITVADICGGWEHRRAVSRELRAYNLACAAAEKNKQEQV